MAVISASRRVSGHELRSAEEGFLRLLRCKGFSARWIEENAADLFAQAQKEYAERLAAGEPADNPAGWLVICAWQRSKNLLESRRRRPHTASIEAGADLADTSTPTPEQQVIDQDRVERIRKVMGYLTEKERRLLELSYFEGMSVREAGRELGWSKSSADRHHQAALERLRAMLGAQRDLLRVEIGLAAWLGREQAQQARSGLPHDLGAVLLEKARSAAASLSNWSAEGGRRLSPLSEPSGAAVAGGALRTGGVCAAAAAACFASGVVGPGIGGVDVIAHSSPTAKTRQVAMAQPRSDSPSAAPETSAAPQSGNAGDPQPLFDRRARTRMAAGAAEPHRRRRTAAEQVAGEFGVESGGSESGASSPSTPTSGTAPGGSNPPSRSTSPSASKGSASGDEFGL